MIQQHCTKPSIVLTLRVLQFVHLLRRQLRPHPTQASIFGAGEGSLGLVSKARKNFAKGLPRRGLQNRQHYSNHASARVCKSRNKPRLKLETTAQNHAAIQNIAGPEVQHVLDPVDKLTLSGNSPGNALSAVAASDELFLRQKMAISFEACSLSLDDITQALILVSDAINVLCACRSHHGDEWLAAQGLGAGLKFDGTFLANYEHLLLRLQTDLVHALEHRVLEALLLGRHNKKQQRLLSWFAEFADKPRPLSTFPWTIKPSLAVLWGVCWMFWNRDDCDDAQSGSLRVPINAVLPNVTWNTPSAQDYYYFGLELTGTQLHPEAQQRLVGGSGNRDLGKDLRLRNTAASDPTHFKYAPQGQEELSRVSAAETDVNMQGCLSTYSSPFPALHLFQSQPSTNNLSNISGNATTIAAYTQLGDNNIDHSSWPLDYSYDSLPQPSPRHQTNLLAPTIRITQDPDTAAPHFFASSHSNTEIYQPAPSDPQAPPLDNSNNNTNFPDLISSYSDIMGNDQSPVLTLGQPRHERNSSINSLSNFPTPISMGGNRSPLLSPVGGDRRHSIASSIGHRRHMSEDRSSISQDDNDSNSPRRNHAFKRSEEPPRNVDNKMVCQYSECKDLVFDRKCEWSKHMDKHDRPYKCNVKGCEKLQGFTYSGGLLRHEREVHKMHGGTKKSLFCPFTDCKRSSGAGFTRKENLAEHIRRVHRRTSMSADLGHLIIARSDSIDADSLNGMRMPPSMFARISEMPAEEEAQSNAMKRKRVSEAGLSENSEEDPDLRGELKRLRRENEEKDSRLRQLEAAVMALQQSRR